ncbi:CheF family chemotaxis protein [Natronomonas sp.]|uniref:CheF family chemotaxis protein n=1 Tax=Natronomonas sp. TaxID=2184060 RepID=UPI00261A0DFA|nr:CheF family chemotaxis protein [Natronomonas sp.]
MSDEQAVADFVGRFARNPDTGGNGEPAEGRIVMSQRRLVVAGDDERLTISLSDVVDVVVGSVPPHLRDLFDSTVTIGYRSGDTVETVLVEADEGTVSKFRTVLFRCLLGGTKARIKHPARVGGRVTDEPVRKAKLTIEPERVLFRTGAGTDRIDITSVIEFQRVEQSIGESTGPTLLVKHADEGQVSTSLVAPLSARRLNLLGRFLRIEYSELLEEVGEIGLTESQKRLLVTIYATGGDIDFGSVLSGDAARATNVLNALREKGLIREDEDAISLTSSGQIIVSQRLEDVNI